MKDNLKLILLIVIWAVVWGFFNLSGVIYYSNFVIASCYFFVFGLVLLFLYKKEISLIIKPRRVLIFITIVFMICVSFLVFVLILDSRYGFFISKALDILFQQLWVLSLLGLLIKNKQEKLFGLIFILIHIPIFFVFPTSLGLLVIFASAVASFIFPLIILRGPGGYIHSYFTHYFFYIVAGLFLPLGN